MITQATISSAAQSQNCKSLISRILTHILVL